jgi:NAD(P)H-flavin reductase
MHDHSQQAVASKSVWLPKIAMIDAIRPEVDDVATYFMRLVEEEPRPVNCLPGQFNMLYVPGCGEVAISVSGMSADGLVMQHTIRHVGRVTNMFSKMQPGSEIGLRGPYGTAWPLERGYNKDVVVVAGGLGLAPLKPVIEAIVCERKSFEQVTVFIGARSPDLLLFSRDYDRWRSNEIEVQLTVDRDINHQGYRIGVVPLLIDRWQPRSSEDTLALVCGPEVMMEYSARSLLNKGLNANSIYVSLERNMQCAVGFCGHCQLGPTFVCKDGPVVNYARVQNCFAVRDY